MSKAVNPALAVLSCLLAGCGAVEEPGAGGRSPFSEGAVIDPALPTRIIVIGTGADQGTLFLISAAARAQRYRELYPEHQVVFYVAAQTMKQYGQAVAAAGIVDEGAATTADTIGINASSRVEGVYPSMTRTWLVSQLRRYSDIRSLDFFTHSAMTLGPRLEELHTLFSAAERNRGYVDSTVGLLGPDNFSPDAYAFLHGCNAGYRVAPALTRLWGIPVAGALNGTDFQPLLEQDTPSGRSQRFFDYYGKPGAGWKMAGENALSFAPPRTCPAAGCRRMKPNRGSKYSTASPIYRFACNDELRSSARCEAIMAEAALALVSSRPLTRSPTFADYREVLIDFLCPNGFFGGLDATEQCAARIRAFDANSADKVEPTLPKPQPICTDEGCSVTIKCLDAATDHLCDIVPKPAPAAPPPSNILDEYARYRRGFCALWPAACPGAGAPAVEDANRGGEGGRYY